MTLISLIGDCTTTTSLAIAAAWPVDDDVVIVEADRSGGSLAAWLDTPATPSLSTVVANARTLDDQTVDDRSSIDAMTQHSSAGIRFVAAPVRSREANRTIGEAHAAIFPLLARADLTVLADVGAHAAVDGVPPIISISEAVLICHRQDSSSAAAATVRLERLAELVEELSPVGVPIVLVVVGDRPFDGDEIARFGAGDGPQPVIPTHVLAVDDLAAAVFAGRTGVSARRLARLPLVRSARSLARALAPQESHDAAEPLHVIGAPGAES